MDKVEAYQKKSIDDAEPASIQKTLTMVGHGLAPRRV